MVGASVVIRGVGIGVVVCCRDAVGMVETDGRGRVVTGVAKEVSCTGVRTIHSEITDNVRIYELVNHIYYEYAADGSSLMTMINTSVPSSEVAKKTVDSSGTPGTIPVPLLEPLVPGCHLLVFFLSLRACIMFTASFSSGVKDCTPLSLGFKVDGFGFGALGVS
ncbi:hypothetical protein Tco_0088406 [Tanacetum coccineum]